MFNAWNRMPYINYYNPQKEGHLIGLPLTFGSSREQQIYFVIITSISPLTFLPSISIV